MLHEVYKLRELFPQFAKSSIESLKNARRTFIQADGCANEPWAEYEEPTLTAYCPAVSAELDEHPHRVSVLICPGGGYEFCSFREAEPIATAFNAMGYNAFVLNYSVAPVTYPQALLELAASVSLIRSKADYFHADKNGIIVCGFSAGAHLAASLGVFWHENFISEILGDESISFKPNAMILGYPVITSGKFAHTGSLDCLLGNNADKKLLDKMSLELQVSNETPPAFIWHTFEDGCVPVENSLLLAGALRKNKVPFELHIFPNGGHGLSLCNEITAQGEGHINHHCANWMPLCKEWINLNFNKN